MFGVLQRIAICYFFGSVIVHYFKVRGAFVFSAFLLLGYWFLCIAANPTDPFSLAGWFGTKIDLSIIGEKHIYRGEGVPFDPRDRFNGIRQMEQQEADLARNSLINSSLL